MVFFVVVVVVVVVVHNKNADQTGPKKKNIHTKSNQPQKLAGPQKRLNKKKVWEFFSKYQKNTRKNSLFFFECISN